MLGWVEKKVKFMNTLLPFPFLLRLSEKRLLLGQESNAFVCLASFFLLLQHIPYIVGHLWTWA
jgi:hypothetical protein